MAESACTSSTSNGTKRKRRAGEEEDETNGKKSRVEDGGTVGRGMLLINGFIIVEIVENKLFSLANPGYHR